MFLLKVLKYFFVLAFLFLSFPSEAKAEAKAPLLKDIEVSILNEDYPQTEKLANEFIAGKPVKKDLDEALYFLGLSQLRQERYTEARDNFQLLISGSPKISLRDKAYLGFVDSLYLDGQYQGALKITEELLSKSPNSEFLSLIYLKLARENLKLAKWDKANGYLQRIMHDFPQSLEAFTAKQLMDEKQYFTVQVGAFLNKERALKLVSDLEAKGEYAYIVETLDRQGRTFYRVRVGQLALFDEAKKLEKKLSSSGYPTNIYP